MSTLATIRLWGEMVKFSHSVFALPFALLATFMAGRNMPGGFPRPAQLGLIVVCMIAARSFAMTFNRIADARIDANNPRTAGRPIPAGRMTIRQAMVYLQISALVFLTACGGFYLLYGNPWPALLAIPTLAGLSAYSFAKRFTTLAHFVLGAVIAFAPTAAWIAIHPATLGWPALLLTGAVLFWISGFDLIYACQDADIDRRDGLFSIPARFGIARALLISRIAHVATVALLIALGWTTERNWLYWTAVGITALLLASEQAVVKPNDLSRVNLAFFTLNGFVSILFASAAIADLIWL
ncbi:MAG: putative 4-hydroxybenzoate polyprenyltransferase [Phycisphaerae bacterium]|nr:putative 4-hydroxybenzoate polyprenyltransferase [Phycisphaerae bacterium]